MKLGNITELLSKIRPAVEEVAQRNHPSTPDAPEHVEAVAHQNIKNSLEQILERSSILKEMFQNGEIGLVAAYYDVETGVVEFMDEMFA